MDFIIRKQYNKTALNPDFRFKSPDPWGREQKEHGNYIGGLLSQRKRTFSLNNVLEKA